MGNAEVLPGDLFIFYGLLMPFAKGHPEHLRLYVRGETIGHCAFCAEMFDAGGYPGVRPSEDDVCAGVLYRLNDTTVLPALDEFEDCDMSNPDSSLYQRYKTPFFDGSGRIREGKAWVYWYTAPSSHFSVIEGGEWPREGLS